MQVNPGRIAGTACQTDHAPAADAPSAAGECLAEMRVQGLVAVPMINHDHVTIPTGRPARKYNNPKVSRDHAVTGPGRQINPQVARPVIIPGQCVVVRRVDKRSAAVSTLKRSVARPRPVQRFRNASCSHAGLSGRSTGGTPCGLPGSSTTSRALQPGRPHPACSPASSEYHLSLPSKSLAIFSRLSPSCHW